HTQHSESSFLSAYFQCIFIYQMDRFFITREEGIMSVLFEKTKIKGMKLNNRLVRSATHESMADDEGFPTDHLFKLYERLAKGGIGLIITGNTYVSRDGKDKSMLGIDTDEHISKYRELVNHVHQNGTKIAIQLNHCGRQTTKEMTGTQPIAPSAVKDKSLSVMPREMTEADIERIIEAFVQTARRATESGFDALQLHGAHGYLINQFLCPHTNRRQDKWGGSIENRMRFVTEIYERIHKNVGDDYPILIKISAYDYMKNGLKPEESIVMAKEMAEMGFDGIEVSCGIGEDGGSALRGDIPFDVILDEWEMKPIPFVQGYNRESAKNIKSKVSVPIFAVGGMIDPTFMEETIQSGGADYISLCRALITDPNFPKKIRAGSREPSRCIHCNLCLYYLPTRSVRCYQGKRVKTTQS
ncbi:MAG: NADH:flavin oxidoreductase, partial [Deltaproteobacteria bacterium]|nr:NADH:flavin oxidoreductase [Deltaproteobacteria bacterium]